MRHRSLIATIVLFGALTTLAVGCKNPKTVPTPPPTPSEPAQPAKPAEPAPTDVTDKFPQQPVDSEPLTDPSVDEWNLRKPLQTVYFEYDSSELDERAVGALRANADWLKANPKRMIRIEGNCDERGTIKYNLALGQKRGDSIRQYLASLGIAADRLRVVSYGEERPVDPGHGEDAWKQNRRAEFWIES